MHRLTLFLSLPLLLAASPPVTLSSNLLEISGAWAGAIGKLARIDASLIAQTSAHRAESDSCQSRGGKEMARALYSCLPLLEIFHAFEPMRLNVMTRECLRDPDSLVSKDFAIKSQRFFALTEGRRYPAADVAIVHTHLIRALVFESRQSREAAIAELDAAIDVIASTKIADPAFDIREALSERKALLAGLP
ncbi:hypothetical protein HUO14_12935 [Parasphingorhabdus flavimaris]|uniref:Uncharacterized protein n=1 Tax=Parasphingorhabdus flavimaris TaxID=266812 RepID=A0ABX2N541_9SPHN|nr:hypothetical protein [Parasphingorhabdus flavimaris]NVD28799.1 hypothetical protein [Parasphingorhabdus flavimaris]|tara:strand:+ start:9178 stop:9753 length:576 start_codon:yes stop_codon:yes gene_type:complete